MATQEKKPSVSRSSSKPHTASGSAPKRRTAPKNSAPGTRTAPSRSRKTAAEKAAEQAALEAEQARAAAREASRPFRRELAAVGSILLALFSVMGFFHPDALFIKWYSNAVKWFIGYGFYVMPLALGYCAYILLTHRGRPVQARIICTLSIPAAIAAIFHGFIAEDVPLSLGAIRTLMVTGQEEASGGLIGGIIGQLGSTLFTDLGSALLLLLTIGLLLLGACDRTIFDLIDWWQARPLYIPEEYEERELAEAPAPRRREPAALHERARRQQHASIDIPMETEEPAARQEPEPEKKLRNPFKSGLFDRTPGVPAPDEVLQKKEREQRAQREAALRARRVHRAEAEAVPPAEEVPAVPVSGMVPDPDPVDPDMIQPQVTRKEAQQAAMEVSRDIAQSMSQSSETPYQYPPLSLLNEGTDEIGGDAMAELNANKMRLDETLHSFGIDSNITHVTRGPSVTRYELELDQGVRLNKLTNLSDDIALALGASGVRIAPIPDRISTVGIEVPNKLVTPVNIYNVIESNSFTGSKSKVSFAVGKDIGGNAIVGNIAKMPHLLIAGTTGSGKSVCTNSLIISLLYKSTPEEVRLIMVDPKMVELGIYNGIPHLLIPVVTDPKKAAGALQWTVCEMMKRYRAFSEVGVRDLASYNAKAARTEGMEKMPQVVVIIDELADLMLVAAKEVEESICRVAQMGRASGMHLIIATQRPSADVITGLMKANIPSRIAFAVASGLESRIILDTTGAEKLVGKGDMLYFPLGAGKPTRVQGCLITDEEVASVVDFVKQQGTAQYDENVMQEIDHNVAEREKGSRGVGGSAPEGGDNDYDELIDEAAEVVVETGQASVSMLQRRLKLGYARAARLVDQLEEKGIVGPFEGSKPRQLMITKEQWQEMKYRNGVSTQADALASVQDLPPFDLDEDGAQGEERPL